MPSSGGRFADGLILGWLQRTDALPSSRSLPDNVIVDSPFIGPFGSDLFFTGFVFITFMVLLNVPRSVWLMACTFGVALIATLMVVLLTGASAGLDVWHRQRQQAQRNRDERPGEHEGDDIHNVSASWWMRFGVRAAWGAWFFPNPPPPELVAIALPFLGVERKGIEYAERLEEQEHRRDGQDSRNEWEEDQTGDQVGKRPPDRHPQALSSSRMTPVHRDAAKRADDPETSLDGPAPAHENPARHAPRQSQEEGMATFVDGYGDVDCQPCIQPLAQAPLDESLYDDDPFPTWQLIPYTVLRYVVMALSVYAALRVLA